MFKFNKVEEKNELDKFKEDEIYNLILKYETTPSHYMRTKNEILKSIMLLEGKMSEVQDIQTTGLLRDIKYEMERIERKLDELIGN